jgi:predicted nucleic acid-binding protein
MESFARGRRVAALEPVDYVGALQRAADHGISGGRVYDLLIAECARLAGVDALLTFNHRHFVDLAQGVEIFVPNPEV